MGRITGLEPATFGTTNQRSNQLSYIRHTVGPSTRTTKSGGADRTRTDEMRVACHQVSQPEPRKPGGADRTRTDEMRVACHQVSQPEPQNLVELIGLEPTTPCMPCKCSTN